MTVAIVSPGYPTARGGVTDHTARLVRHWGTAGRPVPVLRSCDQPPARIVAQWCAEGVRAILIQYVPFLYARRGLSRFPQRLAKEARAAGLKVGVFVHEPWVPPTRLPWLILSPLQRRQLLQLLEACDLAFTPVPAWREMLGGGAGGAEGTGGTGGTGGTEGTGGDRAVLFEVAATFGLGRYGECLEWYAQEGERLGRTDLPSLDQVIERLGGRQKMERLRADPDPARRYPAAMARLDGLIETSVADTLEESVRRFLERVALSTSEGPEVAPDRVNLLTLHATKGLEFDCVYVVGAEDGQLPGGRPGQEVMRHDIEEARRLLYVGMTRARDRLVLTRVLERGGLPGGGNRFLDEMGLKPVYVTSVSDPVR